MMIQDWKNQRGPHTFPGFAFLHVHYHRVCESHWAIARSEPASGRRALVSGCTTPNLIQQLLCTVSPATWDLFSKDCFLTSLSKAGRLLHGLLAPKPANTPKRPHYLSCFPKKEEKKGIYFATGKKISCLIQSRIGFSLFADKVLIQGSSGFLAAAA